MKTIFRNKVALLFFALIMVFDTGTVLGQGLYSKKTTTPTTTTTTTTTTVPNTYGGTGGMLRATGTENGGENGDGGNPDKIEALEESTPLSDGLYLLIVISLGYGLFLWRRGHLPMNNSNKA
jgi:hypothetical protein